MACSPPRVRFGHVVVGPTSASGPPSARLRIGIMIWAQNE